MITMKTLRNTQTRGQSFRIGLAFKPDSQTARNLQEIQKRMSLDYGAEVSWSLMVSSLAAYYLRQSAENKEALSIPNVE
jgi:hypothetical protein